MKIIFDFLREIKYFKDAKFYIMIYQQNDES